MSQVRRNNWLLLIRFFVGILFIFSGLVKANDPLGLSYKMQEFFEVWGLHFLNDYALSFSVIMNAFEVIAGVAVILGWQMPLFSWLLLLLILFFTFLTGYAVLTDKIKECGCFGDCIPLNALQSFYKDLILLIFILILFFYKRKIKTLFNAKYGIVILSFSAASIFIFMWYTLNYLPVVDCLPYKKGNSIKQGLSIPSDAIPDSTVITFVYMKGGKEIEFSATEFPTDFDETQYQFVKRYDKLIRKGNAVPAIKDFVLFDSTGKDVTLDVLNIEGRKIFIFIRSMKAVSSLMELLKDDNFNNSIQSSSIYIITSLPIATLPEKLSHTFECFSCDATAIKTAARHDPTFYFLQGDTILRKWSLKDHHSFIRFMKQP